MFIWLAVFIFWSTNIAHEREVPQSCPCSQPHDCSLPGSSAHGIFQARVLEWGATAFSTGLHGGSYFVESIGNQVVIEFPAKSLTDDFEY